MKICLIDLTNGTNLMRNLGTNDGIYDLADIITNRITYRHIRVYETFVKQL